MCGLCAQPQYWAVPQLKALVCYALQASHHSGNALQSSMGVQCCLAYFASSLQLQLLLQQQCVGTGLPNQLAALRSQRLNFTGFQSSEPCQ